jgi:hypothetical protein
MRSNRMDERSDNDYILSVVIYKIVINMDGIVIVVSSLICNSFLFCVLCQLRMVHDVNDITLRCCLRVCEFWNLIRITLIYGGGTFFSIQQSCCIYCPVLRYFLSSVVKPNDSIVCITFAAETRSW